MKRATPAILYFASLAAFAALCYLAPKPYYVLGGYVCGAIMVWATERRARGNRG